MRAAPLGFVLLALGVLACTKSQLVDVAMSGVAHVPPTHGMRVGDRLVLAGDMHCHVLPPDAPYHVSRDLAGTIELAKKEGLEFVVLTPHVTPRFFMDDEHRAWVLETQHALRARIAELHPELIVIPGFEYTDHRYGHVGMSFADPADVLVGLPSDEARAHPERFFERWAAQGGIVTINHPVNLPLKEAPFPELRNDMSWRAFRGWTVPAEIAWITEHAQAIETFNASVTHLRDQFMIGEEDRSLREAAHLVDRTSREQHRRIATVGGSDSHGAWLRATTFVLASERSLASIREAVLGGRTCVRGPEACTLQVRSREGTWLGVGDVITTTTGADTLEVRASGGDVTYVVNGGSVATARSDQVVSIPIPAGRCAMVRAIVGRSWSSAVYVNCPL
jgi:hypothetical protein